MLKKLINLIENLKSKLPLTYSILLIILVPSTLVINTWWNLRSFERDMNFAIREQALSMQNTFTAMLPDQPMDQVNLNPLLARLQINLPNLISATILQATPDGEYQTLAVTNAQTAQQDAQLFFNQLVWTQETTYFTQTFDVQTNQNVWMAVSPLYDQSQNKIGLINFKISSQPVDEVIARTTRDSLIILTISVIVIILLLINHLKFFQQSLFVEKLKQLDQMKDDFISVASHELRTPLTIIKSYFSLIEETKINFPQEIAENLSVIKIAISRLENLVSDLLNVSRIEQNRIDFTLVRINSTEIIQELVTQHKITAEQKGLQLKFEPSNVPQVLAQADRLREVLNNLIGNAVKYTLQGHIEIKQHLQDNKIHIIIQDTGVGISPEDKQKLFQKFSRIYNEQTREVPGTGLGLWITKAIVEKMHGKIYVDSIMGQGTVFTVILPTAKPSP